MKVNLTYTCIGIIGTGAMGIGIAQIAAEAGAQVVLFDAAAGGARRAKDHLESVWVELANKGKISTARAAENLSLLRDISTLSELSACQLVIEAVVEHLDTKREIFAQLESVLSEQVVLASNTSSLSITALASQLRHPARFVGFHFFNPVPRMKVVEVVSGLRTAPQIGDQLAAFARQLGHTPVRSGDSPGFIVNHAGRGFGTEALRLAQEKVASFADIDEILRDQAGFKLGPFELMDLTALDVSHPVMVSIYHQYFEEPRFRPSPITAQRLAAGVLGRKTGAGFYNYKDGRQLPAAQSLAPQMERFPPVWMSPQVLNAKWPESAVKLAQAAIETGANPSSEALILIAPFGQSASLAAAQAGLDARRVMAIDTFLPGDGPVRRVLATTVCTDPAYRNSAHALMSLGGKKASVIADSAGFVTPRVLATIVNIACEMCQMGVCTPADLDLAVRLGLGYPQGPLAWGDALGPVKLVALLQQLQSETGDARYRVSPWLARRAALGISLLQP